MKVTVQTDYLTTSTRRPGTPWQVDSVRLADIDRDCWICPSCNWGQFTVKEVGDSAGMALLISCFHCPTHIRVPLGRQDPSR